MHIAFIEFDYFEPQPQKCRFSDITWPLATALAERGHQVSILAPCQSDYAHRHINFVPVPTALSQQKNIAVQIKRAWILARAAKAVKADVYHVHQSVMAGMMTWVGLGAQTVWQGHSNYYQRTQYAHVAYDWSMDHLIWFSTKIAAQHVFMAALGERVVPFWKRAGFARIGIAPYGVQLPDSLPAADWSCSAWYEKQLKILYVGRLASDKGGQSELITALSYLSGESIGLAILGDGELRSTLEQQVLTNGLQQMITFCGRVPHDVVLRALASADLLILTSYAEMLPRTILEAWSLRTPVMATDVGAIGDYLIDKQNGYLLTSHAPQYIAQRIGEAKANETQRLKIGQAGQKTARSMMWEKVVPRYEQLYQRVIQQHD